MPTFNLIDEPWLPCRALDGRSVTLGLREVLVRAHELAELRDPSPLTSTALLRLLLAVVHAALRGPATDSERAAMWRDASFPAADLGLYLDRWRPRFDLFGIEHPFYQDASVAREEAGTVSRLAAELASGNNATLFDHTVDALPPSVAAAEAARWLVTTQACAVGFGVSAGSAPYGRHPRYHDAPLAKAACVTLEGTTLFRTLLLNLVRYNAREPIPQSGSTAEDCPSWERDVAPAPIARAPYGYLDYLTWPSRCIHLRPNDDGGTSVTRAFIAQGSHFPEGSAPRDPLWAMRNTEQGPLPLKFVEGRSLWRDSTALFGFSAPAGLPRQGERPRPAVFAYAEDLNTIVRGLGFLRCRVTGIAVDSSRAASVKLWRMEELPVACELLANPDCVEILQTAVQEAESIGGSLGTALLVLAHTLANPSQAPGNESHEPGSYPAVTGLSREARKRAQTLADGWGAEAAYWPALEASFRSFLGEVAADPDSAIRAWQRAAVEAANRAFDLAEQQAGSGARELRARVAARRLFHRLTWQWQPLGRAAQQREEETEHAAS